MYALGILGEGDRKSVEPIAAKTCGDPDRCRATHEQLLHFVSRSPWPDRAVRLEAAQYVVEELSKQEPITTWIIDDTGFLKQGIHSVGVQRQYTGSAGKIANCQIGVSLTIATRSEHVPIDFELYLPVSWTDNEARMRKAKVPEDVVFRTKPQLAISMLTRAKENNIPGEIVLADSAFGPRKLASAHSSIGSRRVENEHQLPFRP